MVDKPPRHASQDSKAKPYTGGKLLNPPRPQSNKPISRQKKMEELKTGEEHKNSVFGTDPGEEDEPKLITEENQNP